MSSENASATAGAPEVTTVRLDHVGLMVADLDPAVDWYRRHLGAVVRDRWANAEIGMEWAHLALGALTLELVVRPGLEPRGDALLGYHHLALVVPDCRSFVERLAADGVTVTMPPSYFERHDMDWAFVEDPAGNVLEILSYRHPPGSAPSTADRS